MAMADRTANTVWEGDLARGRLEALRVAGDHQDVRALGSKLARRLEADAAARARDDAHLLAELQVHGGASCPLRRRRAAILVTCAPTPAI